MTTEVLVIGGGPAGCAAAIQLARGGAQVVLAEREPVSSHKVCGEFLSGEALLFLQRLGIDIDTFGAVTLDRVRLTGPGGMTEHALPFAAKSLTRRRLDDELLRRAESVGARVLRGGSVEHLVRAGDASRATLASGETITAGSVFFASGKHDLRGHPRPEGTQQGLVAFKMYWRLSASETRSLGQAVELISYKGGYAGLQPVEAGLANLCCLFQAKDLRRLGSTWPGLLARLCQQSPHLRQRLLHAEPQLEKPLTIASLPYGFVRQTSVGPWYLGDQAAVIPSFTGDGMSLALHTGMLAAHMFLQRSTAPAFQELVAKQVRRQVGFATAMSKTLVRLPGGATSLLRFWPGGMNLIAQLTRIAPRHYVERGCRDTQGQTAD